MVYAVENGLEVARLGISVGRKKVRRASDRNRTKRLLREAFRLTKHELPIGVDFVVVPRGKPPSFAVVIAAFPELARAAAARLGRIRKGPAQPC